MCLLYYHTIRSTPDQKGGSKCAVYVAPPLPLCTSSFPGLPTLTHSREQGRGSRKAQREREARGRNPPPFFPMREEGLLRKKAVEMRGPAALIFVPAPLKEKRAGASSSSSPQKWILPQGSVFFLGVAAAFLLLLPPLSFHFGRFRTRHAQSFFLSLS